MDIDKIVEKMENGEELTQEEMASMQMMILEGMSEIKEQEPKLYLSMLDYYHTCLLKLNEIRATKQ